MRTGRHVPAGAQISAFLPVDLIDEIEFFCQSSGVQKKKVIELALRRFLLSERTKLENGSVPENLHK